VREARDRYNRAKSRQTLTNTMLGISGAALIGAVTLIFFTDWDGDSDDAPAPAPLASHLLWASRLRASKWG
jgi:hypothetical protein